MMVFKLRTRVVLLEEAMELCRLHPQPISSDPKIHTSAVLFEIKGHHFDGIIVFVDNDINGGELP